jgi:predicted short-subunit dehydrogenase-like oxidoreductase (DUF2520 family)
VLSTLTGRQAYEGKYVGAAGIDCDHDGENMVEVALPSPRRNGSAPPYHLHFSDEIGHSRVSWERIVKKQPAVFHTGKFGFVGAGPVAIALANALSQRGYVVSMISSRTGVSAARLASRFSGTTAVKRPQEVADNCATVFLTVPDDSIESIASATRWRPGQAVLHCSGVTTLDALEVPHSQGAFVGGFHPMQSFLGSDPSDGSLCGITFGLEADPPLREWLEGVVENIGGRYIHLSGSARALYHASAVTACGLVATLLHLSVELWKEFADSTTARQALLPLVGKTLENFQNEGLSGALTGPLMRGDVGTIEKHIGALKEARSELLPIYCHLALAALPIARKKPGQIPRERWEALESALRKGIQ